MSRRAAIDAIALLTAATLLLAASGSAQAQVYVHRAVVLSDDPAPGADGSVHWSFGLGNHSIDAAGNVAFNRGLYFPPDPYAGYKGVFLDDGPTSRAVALTGQSAPGGGAFLAYNLGIPSVNASGDLVFYASVSGSSSGIFRDSGGTLTAVALRFGAAPGGGTYNSFGAPRISNAGEVVFWASRALPLGGEGLFVKGAPDRVIALVGETAPGTGGGTYQSISSSSYAIDPSGDVVFWATVTGGTVSHGLFMDSGGVDSAVALPNDPAPGTGGGTYLSISSNHPGISDAGEVVFSASVTGGTTGGGVFVADGGTDTPVALYGAPAPGGGTYAGIGIPAISAAGHVAFPISSGVKLVVVSGGVARLAASAGDSAPGTGGGTFASFNSNYTSINPSGDVAFLASVTGGTGGTGIFEAVYSPPVPALGAAALALAGLLLAGAGAWRIAGHWSASSRAGSL